MRLYSVRVIYCLSALLGMAAPTAWAGGPKKANTAGAAAGTGSATATGKKSYSAEISRKQRGAIFIQIDHSGSMADAWGAEQGKSKAEAVSKTVNKLLRSLVLKGKKGSELRDYFDVAVLGYGENIGNALTGPLSGENIVTIPKLASGAARIENDPKTEGKVPIYVEPVAVGGTPMKAAFEHVYEMASEWVQKNPDSYPPIIINITDGQATNSDGTAATTGSEGDPEPVATKIRDLKTSDGNALIFNVHISESGDPEVVFPETANGLSDPYAAQLARMSSVLPEQMQEQAKKSNFPVTDKSLGFMFNVADADTLLKFLDIGTRPANR